MIRPNTTEVLESRIAPALILQNPIPDITVGAGSGGTSIELSQMFDPLLDHPGHTIVTFTLNFDADPNTAGVQPAKIKIELFDNEAPLTVQNFLRYATNEDNSAYIGTFLHRLFDFQTDGSQDIIQGGGFPASDRDEHIDTFTQVHNEFSNSRPNTAGTIAMAKTGLGPNTATSEWFININDNSSILGEDNNSGFTVFGQVIEGMDVIQRLAQLPKVKLDGALSDLPVQNLKTGAKVKEENLVTITDVDVAAPEKGNFAGITYAVEVIEGDDLQLLTVQAPGAGDSVLKLLYNAANNGVAKIKVTAMQEGSAPVSDEFTVTLRPNLVGTVSDDNMGSILLPNEGGLKNEVKIQNNGGANFLGNATIKFYLSKIDGQGGDDPQGTIVDDDDILLKTETMLLDIKAGKEALLNPDLFLGPGLIKGDTAGYRLIVKVEPADGTPQQLFTDDDVAVDGNAHVLTNSFGTIDFSKQGFGKRTDVQLIYDDPQTGKTVALSMKGPGSGTVTLNEGDDEITTDDQAELLITGTTAKSKLKIAQGVNDPFGKSVTFGNVAVTDFIGLVDFSIVDEIGNVALSGGAKTVIFGNFNDTPGDTRLTIGGSPKMQPVTIKLGQVRDFSIESTQAIKSITALEWTDVRDPNNTIGGVDDKITATSISSIKVSGNFEANIETTTVAKLSKVSVAGSINNATIQTLGDIGKVTASSLTDSSILAGNALSNLSATGSIAGSTIQAGGGLGTIKASGLSDSSVTTDGNLSSLVVGTITGETTIQADGNINKITADSLVDSTVTTDSNLSNLSIKGAITNSTIQTDRDINKFAADELTDSNVSTDGTLKTFVAGTVDGTTVDADIAIKKFTADELIDSNVLAGTLTNVSVAKLVTSSTIRTTGDIGNVTVGGLVSSSIFAGTDARPAALTDFDTVQTIQSITIKGVDGVTNTFVDSQVAAAEISKIVVRGINPANEGETFGFVADKVGKYSRVGGPTLSKLDDAGTPDTTGDYQLLILGPSNS